jgi:NAD(P)H dehydrogenase (quinone)
VIGVTGATGGLGGRVARHLAERGLEQRLIVRDASRAPSLPGAEAVEASDYGNGEAMRRALEGVDTLFLVSAGEHPDRVSLHRAAVEAAAAAGVERVVYTSFLAAAPDTTFTFGRDHFHTEELIKAAGLGWTFLRNSIYLDYVPFFASADGVIRGPAGDGRVGAVARDDIAEAAVTTLLGPEHEGRAYEVTGGEAITMAEAAQIITEVTGRTVVYVEETLEEARASRAPSGAPDWEIEGWVTSYAVIATGELDVVTDTIERLAGHAPMTLAEFLVAHPESWAHLTHLTGS